MCFTSRACWVSSRGSEKSRPCWAAANSRNPAEGSSGERLQEGTGFGRGEDLREWGSSLQKRGETLFAGGPGEQSEMNPLVGKSCYSRPPFFLPSNLSRRRRAFVSERPFKNKRREERCSPLHLSTGANHYFQPGMFFFVFSSSFFFSTHFSCSSMLNQSVAMASLDSPAKPPKPAGRSEGLRARRTPSQSAWAHTLARIREKEKRKKRRGGGGGSGRINKKAFLQFILVLETLTLVLGLIFHSLKK